MTCFGDPDGFAIDIDWIDVEGTAADRTRGRLRLWLEGTSLWGGSAGIEWTWIELLEHLGRFWTYLILEEGDPIGLDAPPETLLGRARERWRTALPAQIDAEEARVADYIESHDLAAGLHGVYPQSVFLVREGDRIRISTVTRVAHLVVDDVETVLTQWGDHVAGRLAAVDDERASAAIATWNRRETSSPRPLFEVVTNMPMEDAIAAFDPRDRALIDVDFRSAHEGNELLALARMTAGVLPLKEVARLVHVALRQPQVWTGAIDKIAAEVRKSIDPRAPPYKQGYEAAQLTRSLLGVDARQRFDVDAALADWKVPITEDRFSSKSLDAVSIWGPKHGPAIIGNRGGKHWRLRGRRATLGHEIAHLLIDRRAGLPLAEVLGGHVPDEIEQRAKAFAAELLVPRDVAYERVITAPDANEEVGRIAADYDVSLEIVAWQARNGAPQELPRDIRAMLRDLVSEPQRF